LSRATSRIVELSISFVINIGRRTAQVVQQMRTEHGVLPYPSSNREINADVL
jgi:hypothetical protein